MQQRRAHFYTDCHEWCAAYRGSMQHATGTGQNQFDKSQYHESVWWSLNSTPVISKRAPPS
jgi:hypothetical protein